MCCFKSYELSQRSRTILCVASEDSVRCLARLIWSSLLLRPIRILLTHPFVRSRRLFSRPADSVTTIGRTSPRFARRYTGKLLDLRLPVVRLNSLFFVAIGLGSSDLSRFFQILWYVFPDLFRFYDSPEFWRCHNYTWKKDNFETRFPRFLKENVVEFQIHVKNSSDFEKIDAKITRFK